MTSEINLAVDVYSLVDRNATVTRVELLDICEPVPSVLASATGAAKRENGDLYNQEIATSLAVGRALENLGRQLVSKGNKLVREASKQ